MKARLVVFPIRGRNWCFSRSIDPSASEAVSANTPSSLKELWTNISSHSRPFNANAELLIDFFANKMNKAWTGLEKAPQGTFKNKIHGFGLRLLSRVKPSEIFLKSISEEVTNVEVTYPSSLNGRLVRRRLRHIALRGNIIHKQYFYGSLTVLPLTSALAVLPLPNIPFFWILFRTYSHWRALKGSEKLLHLMSEHSQTRTSAVSDGKWDKKKEQNDSEDCNNNSPSPWLLQPSEELEEFIRHGNNADGLNKCAVSDICKKFRLNTTDVWKYRNSL